MKRFVSALTLICTLLVLLLSSGTFAWISDNGMSSLVDITSNARQSYFESGDGTATFEYDEEGNIKKGPYEIKYPIQLYYFAWLQYLGYFNVDNDKDGQIDTVYFYLSDDLHMDYTDEITGEHYKYVLPPIGTTDYPFVGNFDGKGHTIYDLTVENFHDALHEPPNDVGSSEYTGVDVIGFFGVVGDNGVIAGNNGSYNADNNAVKNVVLENLTVKTSTEKALIGLVAGYVNGTVDCVGVVGSTVNIANGTKVYEGQSSISEFALIGYCKDEFKDSVYIMDVTISAPDQNEKPYQVVPPMTGEGSGIGWGGSVKMQDIYGWLTNIRNRNDITVDNYIWSRTDVKTLGGLTVTLSKREEQKKTYEIDGFGSFVFSTASNVDYVNFVSGAQSVTQYKYVRSTEDAKLYYVTSTSGGTNYLRFNNESKTLENTTTQSNATKWIVSDGANGGVISTIVGTEVYYVGVKDGILAVLSDKEVDPTNPQKWKNSTSGFEPRLLYSNGSWQPLGVKIRANSDTNAYLGYSGTNVSTVASGAAPDWVIAASGSGYTISTIINNKRYYLGYTVSGNGYNSTVTLTLTENVSIWTLDGTNQFYTSVTTTDWWGNPTTTNYYLKYSGDYWNNNPSWKIESGNSNATLSFSSSQSGNISFTTAQNNEGIKGYEIVKESYVDSQAKNGYYDENGVRVSNKDDEDSDIAGITYFPLSSTVTVGTSTTTYKPSERNTGYIIGAEWDKNAETRDAQDGNPSNIRISEYAKNSISNVTTPYVISYKTEGKFVEISPSAGESYGLVKLSKCYGEFETSIESNCYGLHFMDAPVSINNLTEITAHLSGSEKPIENYQVPTNCIDFTLYERGFINAFAGSYFQQSNNNNVKNDSIFSIYHIIRSKEEGHENEIDDIKEISKVYALKNTDGTINTDKDYVYIYVGDNESQKAEKLTADGYMLAFDCKWINNSAAVTGWEQNHAYYFEMPVNAGEYAIGSTEGKTGAYLVYLDLAANAQIIERTKEYEVITENKSEATLPSGVEILQKADKYDTENINSVNSSFVSIDQGASGVITFVKTEETVIKHSATSGTTPQYIGANSTLIDGNNKEVKIPVSSTTVIRRTTYYDNNLNTKEYTVTVVTETTVTKVGEEPVTTYHRKITSTVQNEDGTTETTVTEDAKSAPYAPDPDAESVPESAVSKGPDFLMLGFAYGQSDNVTISYEYTPAVKGEDGQVTANAGYRITILNGGAEDVIAKAKFTDKYDGSVSFTIVDGNGNETLLKNEKDAYNKIIVQEITITPTASQG